MEIDTFSPGNVNVYIIVRHIFSFLSAIIFFPFTFFHAAQKSKRSQLAKLLLFTFAFFVLFPIWILSVSAIGFVGWRTLTYAGVFKVTVPTSGPSMLPTLHETDSVAFRIKSNISLFSYTPQKGDIVVFSNEQVTKYLEKDGATASGFVKRVIGTPGDKVTVRDGFVYLNDQFLKEPYIKSSRSTFGGEMVHDCEVVTVPQNQVLVMGDNRKQSADSRHIGLVAFSDIVYYLPFTDQTLYASRWRDASNDEKTSHTAVVNVDHYLELLNQKRKEVGVAPLRYQPKLVQSAQKRAEVMIKLDDFSFEATRSGYTMEQALADVGYSNIVWGEAPTTGYYDEQELIDHYFEFPEWKKFLLNPEFQETGIAAVVGNVNNCPTQVVIAHLAGYRPPNYKPADIDSWRKVLDNLNGVIPDWERAKGSAAVNQEDLGRLLTYLAREKSIAQTVLGKMEANVWLTPEDDRAIKEFEDINGKSRALADSLNKR